MSGLYDATVAEHEAMREEHRQGERRKRALAVAQLAAVILTSEATMRAARQTEDEWAETVAVRAARAVLREAERTEP